LRKYLVLVVAITLSACSTHFDTSKLEGTDGYKVYRVSQEQAFAIAYNAIATVLPGRKISEIDGAVKGYSTWFRFVLDTYTQQVLVIPAKGTTVTGDVVEGFYFEVSGSGSSVIQGRAKNVALYEAIQSELGRLNVGMVVSQIERGSYKGPVFATNGGVAEPPKRSSSSAADRLTELKSLLDRGLISEKEYAGQRAKIIESL
jgi:hypothetical protein